MDPCDSDFSAVWLSGSVSKLIKMKTRASWILLMNKGDHTSVDSMILGTLWYLEAWKPVVWYRVVFEWFKVEVWKYSFENMKMLNYVLTYFGLVKKDLCDRACECVKQKWNVNPLFIWPSYCLTLSMWLGQIKVPSIALWGNLLFNLKVGVGVQCSW